MRGWFMHLLMPDRKVDVPCVWYQVKHCICSRTAQDGKRVVWYLKKTIEIDLTFGPKSAEQPSRNLLLYGLVGYTDSNFTGDPKDRKSVMGYYFFLNGAMVSWSSKKQRIIFTSTTKIKYIVLRYMARGAI